MKERFLNYIIMIMGFTALFQLAISQVHIKTITKIFSPEIGFYLFLFMIFGLVTLFNLTSIKKSRNDILFAFISALLVFVGVVYSRILLNNYRIHESITYNDIYFSLYMIIISMVIYGVGTITILVIKNRLKKT